MKRVLIAGCGTVGTALGQLLSADGHAVWGLRRQPKSLPDGVCPVAADLTASDLPKHLPRQLTDVVYTAAATQRSEQAYTDAYVTGLDNLLRALAAEDQPVKRILFTSSTAVYGQSDGQWVDEDAPTEPTGFAGRCLLEAERRLHDGPYPATVLRLAGIYGPDRTGLLARVCRQEARCPATARYANRIHQDDCAAALHHLLGLACPDPTYIGVDHDPADMRQVLRWLAEELGVGPLPGEIGGDGRANKRCRNRRLVQSGYVFRFDSYRDGYGPLLARFRTPRDTGSAHDTPDINR